jgi:thiosulfate dehydrogenase [quinone] large subunit
MGGVGNFAGNLEQQFAGKLPMFLVTPFAYVLPFVEVLLGALLVIGLFSSTVLIASGLLLMALTFGTVMEGEFPTVANNVMYALVNAALLWAADYNRYSLDHLLSARSIKGK